MPNRIIRDWTDSERIDALSFQAEIMLLRLMMKADDLGAYHANPKLINSFCFPLKNIRETDISRWLQELVSAGLIALYDADNKRYLHIINFGQRMRTVKPKFPQIPENELSKYMSATCQQMVNISPPEDETEYEDEIEVEAKVHPYFLKSHVPHKIPDAEIEKEKSSAKKEKVSMPFESDEFKAAWDLWKAYRKKKDKFQYFDHISEQKALTELFNLSKMTEQTALAIIRQSIDKGWKGFFELKTNSNEKKGNTGNLQQARRR